MQVDEHEGRLFYGLHTALQMLVNRKLGILPAVDSHEDFMALPVTQRLKTRDALYEHPECFDEFLAAGDLSASPDAAEIVRSWRDHRIAGRFYIFRHLKRHTIFLSADAPARAYGVLGLADPLESMFPHPPVLIDALLLPFRGQIIYDGILTSMGPRLYFGGGFKRMLGETYKQATAQFGIIRSLPIANETSQGATKSAGKKRLVALLSSERSRQLNGEEIEDLRNSSPEFERAYHQERGKAHARTIGRLLRERDILPGWFALYEGLSIASAPTREELTRRVREVLPPSCSSLPYLFQFKGPKT